MVSSSSTTRLTGQQVSDIRTHAWTHQQAIQSHLDAMRTLEQDELEPQLTELSDDLSNLEFRIYPVLRQCDTKVCDVYVEHIEAIFKLLSTQTTFFLADTQLQLWIAYLQALTTTLQAYDKYYQKVAEDMVDNRGVIKKMFVSAPLRSLYRDLVETKARAWTGLGKELTKQLTPRVLKEWFTRAEWEGIVEDESTLALDDQCHGLTKELTGWTYTLSGGRIAEIQRERMAQTELMLEHLQKVVEPVGVEHAKVERYFSAEQNQYFASLRSSIVLAQGVKDRMRLIDQNEVQSMCTGVLLMWRHVRIMQGRAAFSGEVPPLPLQLKSWVLQDHDYLNDFHRGDAPLSLNNAYENGLCRQGQGGKRRLMCIVAGLLYKWLEERCLEWKAQKAEQELLTDFGETEVVDPSPTKKQKKKNKKKKNRNSSNSQRSILDDASRDPPTKPHESNGTSQAETHSAEGSLLSSTDRQKTVERETKLDSNPQDEIDSHFPEDIGDSDHFPEDIDDYESLVTVHTKNGALTAQDFLMSRMLELLASKDKGDVIFLEQ